MSAVEIVLYIILGAIVVFLAIKWFVLDPKKAKRKENKPEKISKKTEEENEDE